MLTQEQISSALKDHFAKRSRVMANIADLANSTPSTKVRVHYDFYFLALPEKIYTNSIIFNSRLDAMAWLEECKYNEVVQGFHVISYLITEA